MRRKLLSTVFIVAMAVGCVVPIYDTSRDIRTRQLIFVSEGLRHIPRIWERIWAWKCLISRPPIAPMAA